jgi:hypothetical protein
VAANWNNIRANKYAPDRPPADWPENVQPISDAGLALFGIEPETNKLHWDEKEVILRDRALSASLPLWASSAPSGPSLAPSARC